MCFCGFGCLCGRFLSLLGVKKSGFVPYSDRKNAKNGGFLRVFSDFWFIFDVKMVYYCIKFKNLLKIYRYMYKLK